MEETPITATLTRPESDLKGRVMKPAQEMRFPTGESLRLYEADRWGLDWADAVDAEMRCTGQDAGTLISFGYANGEICGVTLEPEHPAADDERGVIVSEQGWVVGYDAQSGYWTAR